MKKSSFNILVICGIPLIIYPIFAVISLFGLTSPNRQNITILQYIVVYPFFVSVLTYPLSYIYGWLSIKKSSKKEPSKKELAKESEVALIPVIHLSVTIILFLLSIAVDN